MNDVIFDIFWTRGQYPASPPNLRGYRMSTEKENKIWTDCGYFELYEDAQKKIEELETQYDLYKIRRVRDKSKEGWYKVKAWKKAEKKKAKRKKKK